MPSQHNPNAFEAVNTLLAPSPPGSAGSSSRVTDFFTARVR